MAQHKPGSCVRCLDYAWPPAILTGYFASPGRRWLWKHDEQNHPWYFAFPIRGRNHLPENIQTPTLYQFLVNVEDVGAALADRWTETVICGNRTWCESMWLKALPCLYTRYDPMGWRPAVADRTSGEGWVIVVDGWPGVLQECFLDFCEVCNRHLYMYAWT